MSIDRQSGESARASGSQHVGIFLVSAATLLLQVVLTRVFSFAIWYHFAFLVIALALLGFGASGSVAAVWRGLARLSTAGVTATSAALAAAGIVLITVVVHYVPFDPFDILEEPIEVVYWLSYVAAVAIPFFFAGLTLTVILSRRSAQAGTLYCASLVGSGVGCIVFPWAMELLGGEMLLAACSALFCAAALCFCARKRLVWGAALLAVTACSAGVAWRLDFRPCASKAATMFETKHNAERIHSKWSPVFRTDVYRFPDPTMTWLVEGGRRYDGPRPSWQVVVHDGDACAPMLHAHVPPEDMEVLRQHLFALPYQLRPGGKVFIAGVGAGRDVMAALANGAGHIDGVELDPHTLDLLCGEYSEYVGHLCHRDNVNLIVGEARSELRRSRETYDVLQFTGVDTVSSIAAGAYMLSENYIFTIEAFHEYFDRMNDDGLLCLIMPEVAGPYGTARMAPRLCASVAAALEERGVSDPWRHCVVLANCPPEVPQDVFATPSVVVKKQPFTAEELEQIRAFADYNMFPAWHFPGEEIDSSTSKILRFSPEERRRYVDGFDLNLTPVRDDKPFFTHFYKWRGLFSKREMTMGIYLSATGNVVLLGSLVICVVASLIIIVLPVLIARRREERRAPVPVAHLLYFCAIGLGFMFVEITLIQRLVMFLGYPTYSLTITLFALLTFAGFGSLLSRNISTRTAAPMIVLYGCLATLLVVYALAGDALLAAFMHLSLTARAFLAVAAIAPLGLMLGMFFPVGIRDLGERQPSAVPLAWAANGSCSVIATILTLIVAITFGFRFVFLCAVGLYLVAAVCFHRTRDRGTAGSA